MFGWYEISKEANHHLKIRYSVGNCSDCDGEILYNRENGNFYLIELARGTMSRGFGRCWPRAISPGRKPASGSVRCIRCPMLRVTGMSWSRHASGGAWAGVIEFCLLLQTFANYSLRYVKSDWFF